MIVNIFLSFIIKYLMFYKNTKKVRLAELQVEIQLRENDIINRFPLVDLTYPI